jgi:hypothetical protein
MAIASLSYERIPSQESVVLDLAYQIASQYIEDLGALAQLPRNSSKSLVLWEAKKETGVLRQPSCVNSLGGWFIVDEALFYYYL